VGCAYGRGAMTCRSVRFFRASWGFGASVGLHHRVASMWRGMIFFCTIFCFGLSEKAAPSGAAAVSRRSWWSRWTPKRKFKNS